MTRPHAALLVLAVAAVYFVAARLGLTLALVAAQVSPVWPPTGIALAALLLFGVRTWPGVTLGALAANALTDAPAASVCGIAAGNTLEAVAGAWLLRRAGFRPSLERLRDVIALVVLAALGSTTISATVGVASLCAGGVQPWSAFGDLWWVWWIGDAMGALVVTPLLLVWSQVRARPAAWRRLAEAGALGGGTVGVGLLAFSGDGIAGLPLPLQYLVFPFVVWAALRFLQPGTTVVSVLVSSVAIATTVSGHGPFAAGSLQDNLLLLQMFLAVLAVTALLLGAAIAERNAAERRRAADYAAVQVSEERLRLALDAGRMDVWDWNLATREMRWSENLTALHALPARGFDGTFEGFRRTLHPDDRERVDRALTAAVDAGAHVDVEFRTVWPDGSVRWTIATGRVQHDAHGRARRMIGVGLDVTDRKRLEEALRRQTEQLAEADRRKDEFLGMLGHELRNPLAPVSNAVELLRLAPDDPARVEQARATIERQVRHMVRLVDDLLDVSRITSGKIRLRTESIDLGAVVARAIELTRPRLDAGRHELTVSLPAEPVRLEADATRLAQVLANLLDNGAKYTPEGGRIAIVVERGTADVVVRVRDSGAGMSPEMLAHAFDLFTQGESTLARSQGGLGIGLTLVRTLVALHGGTVEATSDGPGRGTEVRVVLPAPPAVAADVAREAPRGDGRPPRARRVLVVDDNADAAESMALLLAVHGHDVRQARSGPEAIATARTFAPDVMLLDLGLPEMDGYAVAEAVRREPALAGCRLVAVTGYGRDEDRRRAREAGFDEHLLKPVDPAVLQTVVASA